MGRCRGLTSSSMDSFRPEQWHDFFITVGGGAAALTGLGVVAMSLHLDVIAHDPALRHRARTVLAALAAVFIGCSLALMGGQSGRAIGAELLIVVIPAAVGGLLSFRQIVLSAEAGAARESSLRTFSGTACYLAEIVGAALLVAGYGDGMYVAGAAMLATIPFAISGSWLLLIGSSDEMPPAQGDG
jgi:hypothetical protein